MLMLIFLGVDRFSCAACVVCEIDVASMSGEICYVEIKDICHPLAKNLLNSISGPQVLLKKLTTDVSGAKHNSSLDSSDSELRSDSSSEKPHQTKSSQNPVTTQITTQESISKCEPTVPQNSISNCETTVPQKSINNCKTDQESTSDCEIAQERINNYETAQVSISNCETAQGSISKCETAQESIRKCVSPSEQLEEDKPASKNVIFEPRVLLARVKIEVLGSASNHNSSEWSDRLRVRPPPAPPPPPVEEIEVIKRERTNPRTATQKKINYCEFSSSEDDEPGFKKRNVRKKKQVSSSEESYSSEDDKPVKRNARKKANVTKKTREDEKLSEYERLRRKNIEEKLAFLEALNFAEL